MPQPLRYATFAAGVLELPTPARISPTALTARAGCRRRTAGDPAAMGVGGAAGMKSQAAIDPGDTHCLGGPTGVVAGGLDAWAVVPAATAAPGAGLSGVTLSPSIRARQMLGVPEKVRATTGTRTRCGHPTMPATRHDHVAIQVRRSNRSAFITLVQAATKSWTNFRWLSSCA